MVSWAGGSSHAHEMAVCGQAKTWKDRQLDIPMQKKTRLLAKWNCIAKRTSKCPAHPRSSSHVGWIPWPLLEFKAYHLDYSSYFSRDPEFGGKGQSVGPLNQDSSCIISQAPPFCLLGPQGLFHLKEWPLHQ